jgi:hypothetical protein
MPWTIIETHVTEPAVKGGGEHLVYGTENDDGLTARCHVELTGTALNHDLPLLESRVREAVESRGKSVIDSQASDKPLPERILVHSEGVRLDP